MKDSLDHLPLHKQQELSQVVEILRAASDDIEMAILFGSYARGDYKEKSDLERDRWSGHLSDYDLLAVTGQRATAEDTTLSYAIAEQCLALGLSATVRPILHDIEHLNIQLAEGQYFFSDIQKEGCWLYNSGKFELSSMRELTPREKQRIARDHYNERFESAEDFWISFTNAFERESYKHSSFQLHQSAEAAYKTILLVFSNYCPDQHYLCMLERSAARYHAPLMEVFPRQTSAEHHRFEQLDQAYIGARYQPSWRITKEDLEYLSPCVRQLLDITETICQARIQAQVT